MARGKTPLPHKRVFSNGKTSDDYYGHIRNEYGQKVWLNLGKNRKKAEADLKKEVARIERLKVELSSKEQTRKSNQTFLEYINAKHYFEPERNVQYVFFKRTGQESYGLYHSKQVANYYHRLFDEDKANDEIGKIPYRKITHEDALAFWKRLEKSTTFKTNIVRNRLLSILASTYTFIMKDDRSIPENPFKGIGSFNEDDEKKERVGMSTDQIQHLFADETTINNKVIDYLIKQNEEEATEKAEQIKASDKSESQKKRLLSNLKTWKEKKNASYKEYRFTDTQYYRFFLCMLGTGARGGELRALQYSAFTQFPYLRIEKAFKEQNSKRASIGAPKWGRKRVIYLSDTLQKMLDYAKPLSFDLYKNKHIFSHPADHFVFSQDGGKTPLCANELRRKWTMFVCAMGFEEHLFTPHSLRHSITALFMENGIPEWLVIKWFGWSANNEMVGNYASKNWNNEYPEYEELMAPIIEDNFFSHPKTTS